MDPFWRQLSDVVLLPLTTQYYPTAKDLQGYANELHPMDQRTDVEENLCLRLTQNFQLCTKEEVATSSLRDKPESVTTESDKTKTKETLKEDNEK